MEGSNQGVHGRGTCHNPETQLCYFFWSSRVTHFLPRNTPRPFLLAVALFDPKQALLGQPQPFASRHLSHTQQARCVSHTAQIP